MTSAGVTDIPAFMGPVPTNAPVADSSRNSSDFMQMMNDTVSKDSDGISILSDHLAKAGNKDARSDASGVPMPAQSAYRAPDRINTDNSQKIKNLTPEKVDKVKNALETFSKGVNDAVKDELDVTDEEITEAMEALGLTYADLMNPANLQKLVAQLSDDDQAAVLLVSDTLPNLLSTIRELSDTLLSDAGIDAVDIKGLEVDLLLGGDIDEAGLKLNDAFAPQIADIPRDAAPVQETMPDEVGIEGLLDAEAASFDAASYAAENAVPVEKIDDTPVIAPERSADDTVAAAKADVRSDIDETDDLYDEPETVITELTTETGSSSNTANTGNTDSNSGFDFDGSRRSFTTENPVHNAENASVQTFVQNVQTDAAEQAVEIVTRYTDVDAESVMQQIVSRASTTITETVSRMEMELNPQNLGRMILQVTQQEGAVTARLIAQSDAVREALESQLAILRDNLNNAGVKVESVEISVGTHEFERALEEGMGDTANGSNENENGAGNAAAEEAGAGASRGVGSINLNDPDASDIPLNEDEILAANMMRDQGNTMSVQA